MKKNNYYLAAFILALVTAGFLLSYPFREYFAGGLLSSLFGAAMIGGFADWFGITALFRKPLGIPFRTEIIPRNRKKLFDSLVYMVENELLSKEILIEKLKLFKFSKALIRYIDEAGGRQDLTKLAVDFIRQVISGMDSERLDELFKLLEKSPELRPGFSTLLISTGKWSLEKGYEKDIIDTAAPALQKLLTSRQSMELLGDVSSKLVERIQEASYREKGGRGLILKILFSIPGIQSTLPERLSSGMVKELYTKLSILKHPNSRSRRVLKKKAEKYLSLVEKNEGLRNLLDNAAFDFLKKVDWPKLFGEAAGSMGSSLENTIDSAFQWLSDEFKSNNDLQQSFDNSVYQLLNPLVEEYHSQIGTAIRERLDTYTTEEIVDMIETRAGNDLQIIRINGSVVGGLVGIVSFLLSSLF